MGRVCHECPLCAGRGELELYYCMNVNGEIGTCMAARKLAILCKIAPEKEDLNEILQPICP